LRERFIKNKRPLNPTHIFLRKEKQPKTRTTRRAVMMSQFDDDVEREICKRGRENKRILQ
jgi:hypothetical protein